MPLPDQRIALYERLVAPRRHAEVLIAPPPRELPAAAARDHAARLDSTPLLDSTVGALRRRLHQRLELYGPVILTGHQAEFFHAGVFAKAIAADALAEATGGVPVYMTVDNDTPKSTALTLPRVIDGEVRRVAISIPGCTPDLPMEHQPPVAEGVWREFFGRLRRDAPPVGESLLDSFERGWFSESAERIAPVDGFMRAHIAAERALRLRGAVPLRVSRLSQTCEFRAFAAHLLLDARRFAADYNAAQLAYRRRRRVRAAQRPVPPLAVVDGRTESPFWVVDENGPRRRLFVAGDGQRRVLFADANPIAEIDANTLRRAASDPRPWTVEERGWQLRPRALSLSAFCRLFLSDVFIHGIGGAKYDEMTEDFVERFFGTAATPMACVTASLLLPLPAPEVGPADVARARFERRDAWYNPARRLKSVPAALIAQHRGLVREARSLKQNAADDREARRANYRALRAVLREIHAACEQEYRRLDERVARLETDLRTRRVATDREYFYALHPRQELERLRDRIRLAISDQSAD